MGRIRCKRIYDPADASDGFRVLVDRLWPRGLKKESAQIDLWAKGIAPSTALRQWFAHDPVRFADFTVLYLAELDGNPGAGAFLSVIRERLTEEHITLLYAAKDTEHNHAEILRKWIEKRTSEQN